MRLETASHKPTSLIEGDVLSVDRPHGSISLRRTSAHREPDNRLLFCEKKGVSSASVQFFFPNMYPDDILPSVQLMAAVAGLGYERGHDRIDFIKGGPLLFEGSIGTRLQAEDRVVLDKPNRSLFFMRSSPRVDIRFLNLRLKEGAEEGAIVHHVEHIRHPESLLRLVGIATGFLLVPTREHNIWKTIADRPA